MSSSSRLWDNLHELNRLLSMIKGSLIGQDDMDLVQLAVGRSLIELSEFTNEFKSVELTKQERRRKELVEMVNNYATARPFTSADSPKELIRKFTAILDEIDRVTAGA